MTRRSLIALSAAAPAAHLLARAGVTATTSFPAPDSKGGWNEVGPGSMRSSAGIDPQRMDGAFNYVKTTSRHGGLLVLRHGQLVFERYFGRANRDSNPNMHSIGKMFTSTSCGIMLAEHEDRFPDGLAQRVFTNEFLPEAFPLTDPRMADIQLGNLLTMTSGLQAINYSATAPLVPAMEGHTTAIVHGENVTLPSWVSSDPLYDPSRNQDASALHERMWTSPGGGYLYSRDPHIASIVLRHVVGMELEEFVNQRLATPMGFGPWGYSLHTDRGDLPHTTGESGIALRSTDALRFGYMLLNHGRWEDRQLVPRDYVDMLSRPSPFNPHSPFSLMFEVNADGHVARAPRDAFFKSGAGGCAIYVILSMDMVIYKMTEADDPKRNGPKGTPAPALDASRDNWKPHSFNQFNDGPVDGDTGVRRTLELVTSAVVA
jgi:CubicO group peptidase (beta-lactamase class C family)